MSSEQQQERTGGCLCGLVRYRVRGAAAYDTFCHCINCQKLTGSVALTASICFKEGFEITSGEQHLKAYSDKATDSGKALKRCFCSECGSNLFAFTPLREDIVGVAAGTLDAFEAWKPNIEQYCMHRAGFLEKIKGVDPSRRFVASVQSEPEAQ